MTNQYEPLVKLAQENRELLEQIYPIFAIKCDPTKRFTEMCDKLHQDQILDDEKLRDLHHYQEFNNKILHSSIKEQEDICATTNHFNEANKKLTEYHKFLNDLLAKIQKHNNN